MGGFLIFIFIIHNAKLVILSYLNIDVVEYMFEGLDSKDSIHHKGIPIFKIHKAKLMILSYLNIDVVAYIRFEGFLKAF